VTASGAEGATERAALIQLKGIYISAGRGKLEREKAVKLVLLVVKAYLRTLTSNIINYMDPAHNLKHFRTVGLGPYLSSSFK